MRRFQAILLLLTLLAGMLPAGAQSGFACRVAVQVCPMQASNPDAKPGACCCHPARPDSDVASDGCCTIQSAPEHPDAPALLVAPELPVALLTSLPALTAPLAVAAPPSVSRTVVPFRRGPPKPSRPSRAPPTFS